MNGAAAGITVPDRATTRDWTPERYLAWAAGQEGRWEFVDGEIVPIVSPERSEHFVLKQSCYLAFRQALQGNAHDLHVFGDGPSVVTPDGTVREPDMTVHRGAAKRGATVLDEPVVLLEVLSARTAAHDRGDKLMDYFAMPSVRHYLIVHPTRRRIIWHERHDGATDLLTHIVADGTMTFAPFGFTVAVADCFDEYGLE